MFSFSFTPVKGTSSSLKSAVRTPQPTGADDEDEGTTGYAVQPPHTNQKGHQPSSASFSSTRNDPSSSTSPAVRSFCVIPMESREHKGFEAVKRDGVVVNYRNRLTSFAFDEVLSPAHNLYQQVIAPVIHTFVVEGRNASLLLSYPKSDVASFAALDLFSGFLSNVFEAGNGGPTMNGTKERSKNSSAAYLPLVRMSMCEIRNAGKTMIDMIRSCPVRDVSELEREDVVKDTADGHWGSVMEQFALRRGAAFAGEESSLFVLISSVETGATCVVGELGFSVSILQNFGLAFRQKLLPRPSSSADTINRSRSPAKWGVRSPHKTPAATASLIADAMAPFNPLTALIEKKLASSKYKSLGNSTHHLVVFPDLGSDATHSMRLLHFVSDLGSYFETARISKDGRSSRTTMIRAEEEEDIRNVEERQREGEQLGTTADGHRKAGKVPEDDEEEGGHDLAVSNVRRPHHYAWEKELLSRNAGGEADASRGSQKNPGITKNNSNRDHNDPRVSIQHRQQSEQGQTHNNGMPPPPNTHHNYGPSSSSSPSMSSSKTVLRNMMQTDMQIEQLTTELGELRDEVTHRREQANEKQRQLDETLRSNREIEQALEQSTGALQSKSEALRSVLGRLSELEASERTKDEALRELQGENAELHSRNYALEERSVILQTRLKAVNLKETSRLRQRALQHMDQRNNRDRQKMMKRGGGTSPRTGGAGLSPGSSTRTPWKKKSTEAACNEDNAGGDHDEEAFNERRAFIESVVEENNELRLLLEHTAPQGGRLLPASSRSQGVMNGNKKKSDDDDEEGTAKEEEEELLDSAEERQYFAEMRELRDRIVRLSLQLEDTKAQRDGAVMRRKDLEKELAQQQQQQQQRSASNMTDAARRSSSQSSAASAANSKLKKKDAAAASSGGQGRNSLGGGIGGGGGGQMEAVTVVAESIREGCKGLHVSLRPRKVTSASSAAGNDQHHQSIEQYDAAIEGIERALSDIVSRQSSGLENVPRTATAGDAALLDFVLSFEQERIQSLRSFVDPFRQLSVSVKSLPLQ